MVGMERDAQREAVLLGSTCPAFKDVALRTHTNGVPRLVFGVPEVEVVVVVTQHEEVLRPCPLVALHQLVGVPVLGLEEGQNVLEPHLRRVSVVLDVVAVFTRAFHIHRAGHPVAGALDTLRPPVCPDAELCVAEPFGCLVAAQRLPRGLILARPHRFMFLRHRYRIRLCSHRQRPHTSQGKKKEVFFHTIG